ncbi:MAG: Lipopolysaccharide export system protein LptA [Pseudomonadota bacterium]|jgi:lipopolysaccharide export system protein LptA
MLKRTPPLFLISALIIFCAGPAHAENADRNQPINLEADKVSVDERNRLHIFEGNVTLTQGTMVIRANKIVVTQDAEGFQKGVATGGPDGLARFKRKREGRNDFVEGEAERIEHDTRSEISQFFNRAYVKSGQDEVRGQYVSYNNRTENYTVTGGEQKGAATPPTRVRAVIMPKNTETAPTPDRKAP